MTQAPERSQPHRVWPGGGMEEGESLRCLEMASRELLDRLRQGNRRGGHRRRIVHAEPDSEELRYLSAMRANANAGGPTLTHLVLRVDARKVEVLEEFLHGTQFRCGLLGRMNLIEAEIHVKRFMMRHCKLLGISPEDFDVIRRMLGTYR